MVIKVDLPLATAKSSERAYSPRINNAKHSCEKHQSPSQSRVYGGLIVQLQAAPTGYNPTDGHQDRANREDVSLARPFGELRGDKAK